MTWLHGWKSAKAHRAVHRSSATLHVATLRPIRCDISRPFSHFPPNLKSSSSDDSAVSQTPGVESTASIAEGVAKQLDRSGKAFKRALNKLRLQHKVVNPNHSVTPLQESQAPRFLKMKSYIQFLTTPTADTPGTALLLHFDEKRYLIGHVHEGVQRAGIEIGAKFAKVRDIFLTGRTEWSTTGGLFGLILTLADATTESTKSVIEAQKQRKARHQQLVSQGQSASATDTGLEDKAPYSISKPTLNIHGGPNLNHSVASARRFIFRKGMPVNIWEYEGKVEKVDKLDRQPDWVDSHIQAWTMAISPSTESGSAGQSPNSRKRSHTEYSEAPFPMNLFGGDPSAGEKAKDKAHADQDLRKHVVSEMFDSSWRLDQLEEHRLSEVTEGTPMFIRDPDTNKLRRYRPPRRNDDAPIPDITVLTRKAWPGVNVQELPPSKPSPVALSYIIRNHYQRGKFLPQKAKDLNVPPGPLWAKLTRGESVQSSDDKTVTSDMVLAEGKEGVGVAVVDVPSVDYVEGLVNRPEWQATNIMAGVGAIFWLLGAGVANDSRLQDFISKHKTLEHVISSPDHCSNYLTFSSAASSAIRLSQINSQYYPIPIHNNSPSAQINSQNRLSTAAQRGLQYQLEPNFEKQDETVIPYLDTAAVLQTTPNDVLHLARDARAQIHQAGLTKARGQSLPGEDAEITCLGTGSALPSKYRNVAGTLLRVPGCGSYLLDCGENTLGQLKRIYGSETMKEILRDLRLIWISHLHADHHLGLVSIIKAWYQEVHGKTDISNTPILDEFMDIEKVFLEQDRLCVAGTRLIMSWLKEYASVEDYGYSKILPLASILSRDEPSTLDWRGKQLSWTSNKPL